MLLHFARTAGMAFMVAMLAASPSAWAQSPTQTPEPTPPPTAITPEVTKPDATPAVGPTTQPGDAFGEDAPLTAKPILYLKGNGNWDNAFETVTAALKKLKAYADKQGLKVDGEMMTIFTATDDTGFQFEAAIPLAEAPTNPPTGDIAAGTSPEGHALKFVHRGSYDSLDNTYEAITNYLDEKRLEAKDMFIEQYVTDPLSTGEDKLVVNVFVLVKGAAPGGG
jgi:effector-binding domain-containing protein